MIWIAVGVLAIIRADASTLFHIPSKAHDSWVLGEEPYVSLHFVGAAHYAKGAY